MKSTHALTLPLLVLILAHCASEPKRYNFKGDANLTIRYQTESSFFSSKKLYVSFFDLIAGCKARFLGIRKFEESTTEDLPIQTGKKIGIRIFFNESSFLAQTESLRSPAVFAIDVHPKEHYEAVVTETADATGFTVYETGKHSKNELESAYGSCRGYIDLPQEGDEK